MGEGGDLFTGGLIIRSELGISQAAGWKYTADGKRVGKDTS